MRCCFDPFTPQLYIRLQIQSKKMKKNEVQLNKTFHTHPITNLKTGKYPENTFVLILKINLKLILRMHPVFPKIVEHLLQFPPHPAPDYYPDGISLPVCGNSF
jgi:hypothetical protein